MAKEFSLSKMQQDYKEWRQTDAWKRIRAKVLNRDGHLCQCCLERQADVVHHLTYRNYAGKTVRDIGFNLVSVCNICHEKIHEKDK